jgi:hypothetical protein
MKNPSTSSRIRDLKSTTRLSSMVAIQLGIACRTACKRSHRFEISLLINFALCESSELLSEEETSMAQDLQSP